MLPVVKAGLAYILPVFLCALALGAMRVTLLAPATGPLIAVALEVPVVLTLSWVIAGRVLGRWPDISRPALAVIAFASLMLLELATAMAFGQTTAQFLTTMTTPAGALGLAGQIGFALIPLVRQARG